MKRTLLVLLVGIFLGMAIALGGVAVTGGWYEYRSLALPESFKFSDLPPHSQELIRDLAANTGGWEPVGNLRDNQGWWYRRPRLRLGW